MNAQRFAARNVPVLLALSLLIPTGVRASVTDTPTPPLAVVEPVQLTPAVADVVKLTKSGVAEGVIVAFIQKSGPVYGNLTADQIVYLRHEGVTDRVLTVMLTPAPAAPAQPVQYTAPAPTVQVAQAPVAQNPATIYNVVQPTPTYVTVANPEYVPTYYSSYPVYIYGSTYYPRSACYGLGFGYGYGYRPYCSPYYGGSVSYYGSGFGVGFAYGSSSHSSHSHTSGYPSHSGSSGSHGSPGSHSSSAGGRFVAHR